MPSTYKERLILFARELRKNNTDAERLMWEMLRDHRFFGLKFRRQHLVLGYIADFANIKHKIIIELDGGQHNSEAGIACDTKRTRKLEAAGWRVYRFWNNEVLQNLEGVFESLMQSLTAIDTLTPALTLGEEEGE